ncbi:MAG TPA: lytic transglycosylase domain-containing protein [Arenibaculum sp.]|nr:lytic transglycosylase domain-containing protein [Arenibaculum sp.]
MNERDGTLPAMRHLGKHARAPLVLACCIAAVIWTMIPANAAAQLSASDVAAYRAAFQAADSGRWDEAHRHAARADERLPAKVVTWMELARVDRPVDLATVAAFIRANPDWPNTAALRRNAERVMPAWLDPSEVRTWFAVHPPLTGAGVIRYASALLAGGDIAGATELVRERWVGGSFGVQEEREIHARFGTLLRPTDHIDRLDRLLWNGDSAAALRMFPLVDAGWKALAEARLALAGNRPGVDALIRRVPTHLSEHPGLLYERLRWRRQRDMNDGALEIVAARPADAGRPEAWWAEQHILARRAIERGDYRTAYRLAGDHAMTEGVGFAQAEFLAGWLALRFLSEPAAAARHFETLYDRVGSPISRSRGAYWAGRAAEASGRDEEARRWYGLAAGHMTTFYGLLAAERLDHAGKIRLPPDPVVPADAASAFEDNELARIARMLHQIDPDGDREAVFVRRLGSNARTPLEYALVTALALDIGRPDLAVWVAKQGVQDDVTLVEGGYPVVGPAIGAVGTAPVDDALVHALIRQESTFNRRAVSAAGARGLMQLMPGTAREVAGKLGLSHSNVRLTDDPDYNVRLGSSYMQGLLDRFNGSYVLAIASYNAGPARVRRWLAQFGDPRAEGVDVVDWIELIPIYETRNYVQRVMEGLYVYRARLGGGEYPLAITRDLRR